ncbi:hypothetical protein PYCC9005_005913 [Savitreella phatthalungensis]
MLAGILALLWMSLLAVSAQEDSSSWEARHMRNEHHLQSFDNDAFFRIHDLDRSGVWTREDISSLYGAKGGKEQDNDVPMEKVREIEDTILRMMDRDGDDRITRDEFVAFKSLGGMLPDFGYAGHHEDEETEFDIHHVEIFHSDPNDQDESKWNHPEDIAHFKKHDEQYHGGSHQDPLENIPHKFRKGGL